MPNIQFREATDDEPYPRCPHCGQDLNPIVRYGKGVIRAVGAFACPHCHTLLTGLIPWP